MQIKRSVGLRDENVDVSEVFDQHPGTGRSWACKTCGAMVADDRLQLHQSWHDGEQGRNFMGF